MPPPRLARRALVLPLQSAQTPACDQTKAAASRCPVRSQITHRGPLSMNLPNLITVGRLFLVPFVVVMIGRVGSSRSSASSWRAFPMPSTASSPEASACAPSLAPISTRSPTRRCSSRSTSPWPMVGHDAGLARHRRRVAGHDDRGGGRAVLAAGQAGEISVPCLSQGQHGRADRLRGVVSRLARLQDRSPASLQNGRCCSSPVDAAS